MKLAKLMPTSLFRELEKGELAKRYIVSIRRCTVWSSYLHQWKPHPIIKHIISSGNVLLEPLRQCLMAGGHNYLIMAFLAPSPSLLQ